MRFILVVALVLFVLPASAQTVALAGAKTLTGTTTSLQIASFDTIACALRYMARTGPWWSQRQLDSAKATGGFTPADTLRIYSNALQAGMKIAPTRIILAPGEWTPGATYIKQ